MRQKLANFVLLRMINDYTLNIFGNIQRMSQLQHCFAHTQRGGVLGQLIFVLFVGCLVAFAFYAYVLNDIIIQKFEQRKWDIPARVYSRPLLIEQGALLNKQDTKNWLALLHYSQNTTGNTGTYTEDGNTLTIHTRGFDYGDNNKDQPKVIRISFDNKHITKVQSTVQTPVIRLEPVEIGSIYPDSNEDREFVPLEQTPSALIDALIATEDRNFYHHHGISIRGTARAILNNFQGKSMQGGSTLTQQLIKNFYLSSERSLKRKANEAVMAILLERQYSKNAILQVYLNEIYLGQNGNQSINGFGIASRFYFNKPLGELHLDQYALLVGLAKGASYYNPRKHPERALTRRNIVLHNMLITGKITQEAYENAIAAPLGVIDVPAIARPKFPDFFDYARRELTAQYDSKDLQNAGLTIITTLNPLIQTPADTALKSGLAKHKKKQLQGALVAADPHTGEILALVGSGDTFTGFNRVLDAKRQVGSLLKPVIYLTALQSGKYNLASGVLDEPITYNNWTPKNYGGTSHGVVPLTTALAQSYNQAAVNVGMDVGLNHFVGYLKHLGITEPIPEYPSTLLGAVELSPMQVLGIYQVFASGGIYHTPYSIERVINEQGTILQKNQPQDQQRIPADAHYLLHTAMTHVIQDGTAKAAKSLGNLNLAGKTGTTNDNKDAWFAGYSGNYVAVVWMGRDDNQPIGLTGSSGALPIWVQFMQKLKLTPTSFIKPSDLQMRWVENGTGRATESSCQNAVYIPTKKDSVSQAPSECALLQQELLQEQTTSETKTPPQDEFTQTAEETSAEAIAEP